MAGDENDFAYIARCKCGCQGIVLAIVDDLSSIPHRCRVSKEIAKAIRDGYAIERTTVGIVRQLKFGCQAHKMVRKVKDG